MGRRAWSASQGRCPYEPKPRPTPCAIHTRFGGIFSRLFFVSFGPTHSLTVCTCALPAGLFLGLFFRLFFPGASCSSRARRRSVWADAAADVPRDRRPRASRAPRPRRQPEEPPSEKNDAPPPDKWADIAPSHPPRAPSSSPSLVFVIRLVLVVVVVGRGGIGRRFAVVLEAAIGSSRPPRAGSSARRVPRVVVSRRSSRGAQERCRCRPTERRGRFCFFIGRRRLRRGAR